MKRDVFLFSITAGWLVSLTFSVICLKKQAGEIAKPPIIVEENHVVGAVATTVSDIIGECNVTGAVAGSECNEKHPLIDYIDPNSPDGQAIIEHWQNNKSGLNIDEDAASDPNKWIATCENISSHTIKFGASISFGGEVVLDWDDNLFGENERAWDDWFDNLTIKQIREMGGLDIVQRKFE